MGTSLGRAGLISLLLLVLVALLVSGWANLWKRELLVQRIRVQGNRYVSNQEIIASAALPRQQNLFDIDLFGVQQRILTNRFLKSASVRREPPAELVITVEERVPLAAIMLGGISYLDEEGFVLPPLHSRDILDVPVLTGMGQVGDLQPGKCASSPGVLEALSVVRLARKIDDHLYRQISEVHAAGKQDLMFYTAESGVPVLVGHDNIGVKLVQFESFWKQFVDPRGPGELQYVDLRFQGQIVVKWHTAPGQEGSSQRQGV
jgi:cell division protein FtsQ